MVRLLPIFLMIPCILLPSLSSALTIDEAVRLSLENNHMARQYGELAKAAESGVTSSRSGFFPELNLRYSYIRSDREAFNTFKETSIFTMEAAYTLFKGFADMNAHLKAKAEALAASYTQKSRLADVVLEARAAYINVLRTRHAADTARESVELLERQIKDSKLYYESGLIARNELLKAEVELSSARRALIEDEGNHRIAIQRLEHAIGSDLPGDESFADISANPRVLEMTYEALREEMYEKRSELMYYRAVTDAYRSGMRSAAGGYLPRVDLSMSLNTYGDDATPSGSEPYDDETLMMVTASWNIFDGFGTTGEVLRARHELRASEEELKHIESMLSLQLKEAMENCNVSLSSMDVSRAAVSQAEENYRVTENLFRQRIATTTDLLDARNFLSRARTEYYNAVYGLHLSAATIERIIEKDSSLATE